MVARSSRVVARLSAISARLTFLEGASSAGLRVSGRLPVGPCGDTRTRIFDPIKPAIVRRAHAGDSCCPPAQEIARDGPGGASSGRYPTRGTVSHVSWRAAPRTCGRPASVSVASGADSAKLGFRARVDGRGRPTRWNPDLQNSIEIAVHAALLHTGQIVYFGGSQVDPFGEPTASDLTPAAPLPELRPRGHAYIFDCQTGDISAVDPPSFDTFCCGHALLEDGRLLIAGGTHAYPPPAPMLIDGSTFSGIKKAAVFDPATYQWTELPDMSANRWYPTVVTLSTGEALVLEGQPGAGAGDAHTPERIRVGDGEWSPRPRAAASSSTHTISYPRVHQVPGGDLICMTPLDGSGFVGRYNPETGPAGAPEDLEGIHLDEHHYATSTVLLPLLHDENYRVRILHVGGAASTVYDFGAAEEPLAHKIHLRREVDCNAERYNLNAVLLPTGEVLVCGGRTAGDAPTSKVELYGPFNQQTSADPEFPFSRTARCGDEAGVDRGYHAVALLMPDGRVWTAGFSKNLNRAPNQITLTSPQEYSFHTSAYLPVRLPDLASIENRELAIEIFEPDYCALHRPTLSDAPPVIHCGSRFPIKTPDPSIVGRVALLRAGSCTHAWDGDQRYVTLDFQIKDPETLDAAAPCDATVAPPGYYLLFVLDRRNIPSVGRFVRLARCIFTEILCVIFGGAESANLKLRLGAMRSVRNEMRGFPDGDHLLRLINKHTSEMFGLVTADPKLLERTASLFQRAGDFAVASMEGRSPKIERSLMAETQALLSTIASRASQGLQADIHESLPRLANLEGKTLREVLDSS